MNVKLFSGFYCKEFIGLEVIYQTRNIVHTPDKHIAEFLNSGPFWQEKPEHERSAVWFVKKNKTKKDEHRRRYLLILLPGTGKERWQIVSDQSLCCKRFRLTQNFHM